MVFSWSFICILTLFKALESVKIGLKRVKKKNCGEKIGPRLGKKIDRLEVYASPRQTYRDRKADKERQRGKESEKQSQRNRDKDKDTETKTQIQRNRATGRDQRESRKNLDLDNFWPVSTNLSLDNPENCGLDQISISTIHKL